MVFTVIVPIFLLLFLGYLSVKLKILVKDHTNAVGTFVIRIALPALLLHSLAEKNLHEIWIPSFFGVYTAVTFLLYCLALYLSRQYFRNSLSGSAVLALGAAMSNTGLIGTAVLTMLMGHAAMTPISLVVIIESVLLVPTVMVLAQLGRQSDLKVSAIAIRTVQTLIKNPLFMSVVIGISLAALELKMPHQIDEVLTLLGHTASPLALFSIGGGIVGLSLRYVNLQSFYLVASSNILMPLLMFLGLSYLTELDQDMVYAGTLIAALPMPTIFGMLGQAYGISEKTLTPLLMSTIFGFMVTIGLITVWWS